MQWLQTSYNMWFQRKRGKRRELSGAVDDATVSAGARRIERRLRKDKALAQKAKQVGKGISMEFDF